MSRTELVGIFLWFVRVPADDGVLLQDLVRATDYRAQM